MPIYEQYFLIIEKSKCRRFFIISGRYKFLHITHAFFVNLVSMVLEMEAGLTCFFITFSPAYLKIIDLKVKQIYFLSFSLKDLSYDTSHQKQQKEIFIRM